MTLLLLCLGIFIKHLSSYLLLAAMPLEASILDFSNFFGTYERFLFKENHIDSVVSEIFRYTQTEIPLLYYKDCVFFANIINSAVLTAHQLL